MGWDWWSPFTSFQVAGEGRRYEVAMSKRDDNVRKREGRWRGRKEVMLSEVWVQMLVIIIIPPQRFHQLVYFLE